MESFPISSLDGLGAALVNQIGRAIEGLARPAQIRRVARANSDADYILAEGKIKISELEERTQIRLANEELRRQENMEKIIQDAVPQLLPSSRSSEMDGDWIVNFFEKSRITSNEDMQLLWSRILAGEANKPGKFCKRTINLLAAIDENDAKLFQKFCGTCWDRGEIQPLIFDPNAPALKSIGIDYPILRYLEEIGLITFSDVPLFIQGLQQYPPFSYFGRQLRIEYEDDHVNGLQIGRVLFSRIGRELYEICDIVPVVDYFDNVANSLIGRGYKVIVEG